MNILLEAECAGGADRNAVGAIEAAIADGLGIEGGDDAIKAPVGKAQQSRFLALMADPDTPSAEDALIRVESEEVITLVDGQVAKELAIAFRFELAAQVAGQIL